jgi:hypothetical protein
MENKKAKQVPSGGFGTSRKWGDIGKGVGG